MLAVCAGFARCSAGGSDSVVALWFVLHCAPRYDYYFASATNTKLTYGKVRSQRSDSFQRMCVGGGVCVTHQPLSLWLLQMITVIQLVQMVVGLSVTGLWTFMYGLKRWSLCSSLPIVVL